MVVGVEHDAIMIAVIDYGAGNLRSAVRALEHVGARLHVTNSPQDVAAADAIVLPGVGATRDTMEALQRLELAPILPRVIAQGVPFLGICVGMQVLAEQSEEWGLHPCLGVVQGTVRRFPAQVGKIPQIGWNQVHAREESALLTGIPDQSSFYFVHSYYVDTPDTELVVGQTEYGIQFPAVFQRRNIAATQFHPEKSGRWGLQLLANWVESVS